MEGQSKLIFFAEDPLKTLKKSEKMPIYTNANISSVAIDDLIMCDYENIFVDGDKIMVLLKIPSQIDANLSEISQNLKYYIAGNEPNLPEIQPTLGQLCLLKKDENNFFRGRIWQLENGNIKSIIGIDSGQIFHILQEKVWPLPKEFQNNFQHSLKPFQLQNIWVKNSNIEAELKEVLQILIKNQKLFLTKKKVDDNAFVMEKSLAEIDDFEDLEYVPEIDLIAQIQVGIGPFSDGKLIQKVFRMRPKSG